MKAKKTKKAMVNLILQAHLPYIRHEENEHFFEEDWYYEALTESYFPLVRMFHRLEEKNTPYRITLVISPSLAEMLKDKTYSERFEIYLKNHIALGESEVKRLEQDEAMRSVANDILNKYKTVLSEFEAYGKEPLNAFISLLKNGNAEIITSVAAHPFLPLYESRPALIKSGLTTAAKVHFITFKNYSKGIWFPDCGYYPGLDEILKKNVLESRYFYVSPTGFALSDKCIKRGCYAPVHTSSGLYAFALDMALRDYVTSSFTGYPGDDDYREFYRDIGFDLDIKYIRSFLPNMKESGFTGYKYYAVSGKRDDKKIYNAERAAQKTSIHADHFVSCIEKKAKDVSSLIDLPPIFNIAFDTELFGHWWSEGVEWLEKVLVNLSNSEDLVCATSSDYLDEFENDVYDGVVVRSSNAFNTYSYPYIDGENSCIQRSIFNAIDKVEDLSTRFKGDKNPVKQRYIKQAVKEILLVTSSDWPQLIHNNTCTEYATMRINEHLGNINKICDLLSYGKSDTTWLVGVEKRFPLFEGIDYRTFTKD